MIALLLGDSVAMRAVRAHMQTAAGLDVPVLIEGEIGTGKTLAARAIHAAGRRKDQPFAAINCAGLADTLLASQLFGHRRGAFAGAGGDRAGAFETIRGGTILLDEIADMPVRLQANLHQALTARRIHRLGDAVARPVDVRVLVSTHRSLEAQAARRGFREDLLAELRAVRIRLPALRERREDIPLLATAFVQHWSAVHRKPVCGISLGAMDRLVALRWPGNVRELRTVIEWAVMLATDPTIQPTDLPDEILGAARASSRRAMIYPYQPLLDTLSTPSVKRAGGR